MQSAFDPALILQATTEQASERREPLPADDYTAAIGEVTLRAWKSKDGSKSGWALDVPLLIQVPAELQASMELPPTLTLKDSCMLDMTPSNSIDYGKGKNGKLRTYREATDLNKSGEPFSPAMLTGRMVKVKIKHEEFEGWPQERPSGVSAL